MLLWYCMRGSTCYCLYLFAYWYLNISVQKIDEKAVNEVYKKVLDNYFRWCKYLRTRMAWTRFWSLHFLLNQIRCFAIQVMNLFFLYWYIWVPFSVLMQLIGRGSFFWFHCTFLYGERLQMFDFSLNAFATYSTMYTSALELLAFLFVVCFHKTCPTLLLLKRVGWDFWYHILSHAWLENFNFLYLVLADGKGARCNPGSWRSLCCKKLWNGKWFSFIPWESDMPHLWNIG